VANAYAAIEEKRHVDLARLFRQRRIDSIPLRTDTDYLLPLRSFFETRERRQAA
jgi:hypothetical protein